MIATSTHSVRLDKAKQLFDETPKKCSITWSSLISRVLTACAVVSAHSFGPQVHGHIVQTGFEANMFVESALVDMYAKCEDLNSARRALETMGGDNVVSWNSRGFEEEALLLFKKMHARDKGIDDFTYPFVLNSRVSIKDMKNAKSVHCLIVKTRFEVYKLVSNALVSVYAKG
ncbi:hypothetical protein ACSBR2_004824 [Camellia fascicularis]